MQILDFLRENINSRIIYQSDLNKITSLILEFDQFKEIKDQLFKLQKLETLHIHDCHCSKFELFHPTLIQLTIKRGTFSDIELKTPQLNYLTIEETNLSVLIIKNMLQLKALNCSSNKIKKLIIESSKLLRLTAKNNDVKEIIIKSRKLHELEMDHKIHFKNKNYTFSLLESFDLNPILIQDTQLINNLF